MGLNDTEFQQKLGASVGHVKNFAAKAENAFNLVAGAAAVGFFSKLLEHAGAIQDTAEALDVTTDSLQAMNFTAKQSGVSVENLHAAYGILKGKASDAANGNKEVVAALERLGIKAADFIRLPVDRQLELIAKGAANAEDKTKAFGAVADLIGTKNAPRMNAMLQQLAAEGLDGVTDSARKLGQVIESDTIQKMDDLGDRWDALKNTVFTAGSKVFEGWAKIGDWVGGAAAAVVNAVQGIDTAWEEARLGAEKAEAAIEKVNVAMKGTAATADELKKAAEAQAKAEESMAVAKLDAAQKLEFYEEKLLKSYQERWKWDKDTKEALAAQAQINETLVKLNDVRKKQGEDIAKEATEFEKKTRLERELQIELLKLEYKGVGNLSALERIRYDQLQLITKQKTEQALIDQLLEKGVKNLTKEEAETLKELLKATGETGKQIAAKKTLIDTINAQTSAEKGATAEVTKQVDEVYRLNDAWDRFMVTVSRTGTKDNTKLTDAQLAEKVAKLQSQFDKDRISDPYGKWDYMKTEQLGDLENAKREQALRSTFRREVGLYGETRALSMHSAFDEDRLKSYLRAADETKKAADGIAELNQRLSFLFPVNGSQ